MKNRILFLGGLCLVLALGLVFIGCGGIDGPVDHPDFDEIGITVTRAGNGEATGNSNNNFLVEWTAVEGATSYSVVFKPVGQLSYNIVGNAGYGKYNLDADKKKFTKDDNAAVDIDAFSSLIDMSDYIASSVFPNNTIGQFGVLIIPLRTDRNPVVVWDEVEYLVP